MPANASAPTGRQQRTGRGDQRSGGQEWRSDWRQQRHQRARRRHDALLRKAAATTFEHEAAACRAKAETVRNKYGL